MPKVIQHTLPVPSANASGAWIYIGDMPGTKTVKFVDPGGPAWAGTVAIELSDNGTSSLVDTSGVTAAGVFLVAAAARYMRATTSGWTAGALTAAITASDRG